jgi:hypothetical protein
MPSRRPAHRELALDSTHWRRDGRPKTRFASRAEALSVAEERTADDGARLTVYRCAYCDGWHMGSRGGAT